MDKFLETTTKTPKLKQEETENLNRLITSKEIESLIKKFQKTEVQDQIVSQGNLKKSYFLFVLNYSKKIGKEGKFPNSFYEANIILLPKPDKDTTKEENYRSISLMNIDAKILNKILANQIQQFI